MKVKFGSMCPICGKRPELEAEKIPAGAFIPPCFCLFDKNHAFEPMTIETWERLVEIKKDEIWKDSEKGTMPESVFKPEDIVALCKSENRLDVWPFLIVAMLFGRWGNNSSSDYWRGKYDALKETMEKEPHE